MSVESFSWAKFWSGIGSLVGWAKFGSFWVKIAIVIVPVLSATWFLHSVYKRGYDKGCSVTAALKDTEFKKWIAEHPQINAGSGTIINNNVNEQAKHFQFGLYPLRVGWCQ